MANISEEMLAQFNAIAGELGIDLGVQGLAAGERPEAELAVVISVSQEIKDLAIALGRICGANGLYRYGRGYVTVHENESDENDLMCEMTEDRFVSWVQNYVSLVKWNEKAQEDKPLAAMTGIMAKQVMAAHEFRDSIPKVKSVLSVRMPVWRDKVPVLLDLGYNPLEEIYVIKDVPDVQDLGLDKALEEYEEIWGQFPMDGPRSKAAHVACGVGLFSKYLFPTACAVPLFQYTANMEGAGKSLAAKSVIIPVYGSSGSNAYGDGDKFKEMLNSVAASNKGYVFFDDVAGSLFNQDLNRWVTDSTWEFRVFHSQRLMRVEKNCMTLVTDNGCTLSDDLIRRSVIVRMDVSERAVERQKKLTRYMDEQWLIDKKNRGRVLSVWWSMICHWHREGMADAPQSIPSFRGWTNVVGGIVAAAGLGNAFEAANMVEGGDKRRTEVDRLIAEVVAKYCSEGETKVELLLLQLCAVARENSLFEYELNELHLVKQEMDSSPGRYYDVPSEGTLTEQMRYMQALEWMHPQKMASPFSKRLKKQLGMHFVVGGAKWVLSMEPGRKCKYIIELVEPF